MGVYLQKNQSPEPFQKPKSPFNAGIRPF